MTHDEALQEIGVSRGSSPEEIRRAYRLRTRTWNPAADPDGLQRLRAAHDLLLAAPPPQAPPSPPPTTAPAAPAFRPLGRVEEPDTRLKGPEGRWLVIFGGGLILFLSLLVWVSRFQEANLAAPPTPLPYVKPPVAGYESAQQGLNELCMVRGKEDVDLFCDLAEKALAAATETHKCSDAELFRKRLGGFSVKDENTLERTGQQKLDSFREKLDEEIARCWKFWNT